MNILTDEEKKLYSQKGIGLATFLGSPLAASILVRHNYLALGNKDKGNLTLVLGIIITAAMFFGLLGLPEHLGDKVPSQLIPGIYTLIVYLLVEKFQGKQLKAHELADKKFMSNWKASGIGLVCLLLLLAGIFAPAYLDPSNIKYDKQLERFIENEKLAMKVYDHLSYKPTPELIQEINEISIPKWMENIEIMDSLDSLDGLTTELKVQNSQMRKYSELRIEELNLRKRAMLLNTYRFNYQLDSLSREMDRLIGN